MEERVSTKRGEGGNFKEWMRYWEKNEGKVGALWPARLSFQECIWLWLMSSQRSAVAGAPAHFQGPQGRKRGKWGNREQWARVRLPVMDFTRTIPSDSYGECVFVKSAQRVGTFSHRCFFTAFCQMMVKVMDMTGWEKLLNQFTNDDIL